MAKTRPFEEKAKQLYFNNVDSADIVSRKAQPLSNHGLTNTTAAKKVIRLNDKKDDPQSAVVANSPVKQDNINRAVASNGNRARFKSHSVPNVQSGHYLIANVFRDSENVSAFIEELRAQGIEANYFENPKNGLNYVYIGDFENKTEALDAYRTKMNGAYGGDAWIMNVNGGDSTIGGYTAVENGQNSKYGNSVLHKNLANKGTKVASGVSYSSDAIDGLPSGFYIIANVFETSSSATQFVKELNAKGLNASYFINPNDKLRYVYLKKHETWGNALTSYYTKLNASYDDEMWILRIKPNRTV